MEDYDPLGCDRSNRQQQIQHRETGRSFWRNEETFLPLHLLVIRIISPSATAMTPPPDSRSSR